MQKTSKLFDANLDTKEDANVDAKLEANVGFNDRHKIWHNKSGCNKKHKKNMQTWMQDKKK